MLNTDVLNYVITYSVDIIFMNDQAITTAYVEQTQLTLNQVDRTTSDIDNNTVQ